MMAATRKSQNARIVREAVRMLWLRADPATVAAYIDSQVPR